MLVYLQATGLVACPPMSHQIFEYLWKLLLTAYLQGTGLVACLPMSHRTLEYLRALRQPFP
ncbi:MAG: hypothetical protein OJF51_004391 [Nitrospira sp.]|nr:MAG: hypothetical protein OJF51_004391 [Nitrospira sp.]